MGRKDTGFAESDRETHQRVWGDRRRLEMSPRPVSPNEVFPRRQQFLTRALSLSEDTKLTIQASDGQPKLPFLFFNSRNKTEANTF